MEKLIDIEDRIPALRRKRKRRMTFTFSILLFLFFTVLLLVLYLQSSISKIQQITVEGTYIVDEQQLLDASSLEIGQSLWSFRASAIEDLLVESPGIEQAEVSRKRWSEVVVTVSEYQPVAFRQTDDSLLLLENGEEMSAQFAGSLFGPALQNFDNKEVEQKLISELGKLTQQTRLLISEIASTPSASDPNLVTLYMNDGNTVIVSALDFSEKLSFYPSVLQQIPVGEKGIVDMEVGTFFESYSSIYGGEGEEVELDEQQENE
ncbi:cell division protein FtsQ [Chryseomicrobium aureum]|uniref:cell division protein FtsQ/DivIB n=1 Tax=Chryseomicrobium aureum TaxID=1441723 RepID=UPI001EF7962B|nr:FtsQ-type POTRA domain-containing protein [Chryseomicrobium aureum]MBM7705329.1 cell division protein FtsQ [Chryseomicrobium aureum]